jgi:valyl-tRNA synthetase
MAKELSKTYNPGEIEKQANAVWNENNSFHTEPPAKGGPDAPPYTIVIPPPNVTGMLHMGHALNNTLQDVQVRFKRMQGFNTLWMPGTDHAGIATQSVVEKKLKQEKNLNRHDVGREKLVEMIWDWKNQYGNTILEQLKGIGASCDWERTRFTLDDICARAVRRTFYRLFGDELIYKGKRLVNWDTELQTAVADDEVFHKTVQGNFYYINYPLIDGSGHVTVATTRPETMLGDTAVAVNPKDERAAGLIGRRVKLPLTDRDIPIIADDYVKRGEGTGFLKVTPAHDPNDYEIGLRHGLEQINILTPDGYINSNGGRFEGMDRMAARKAVVAALEEEGLLEKIEPREQEIGHSDRSGTMIEPYLSDQWFVKVEPLAKPAIKAVEEKSVRIHPQRYEKSYLDWLSGIRDWCISRQLWWGHRIPIWSRDIQLPADVEPDPVMASEIDPKLEAAINAMSVPIFSFGIEDMPIAEAAVASIAEEARKHRFNKVNKQILAGLNGAVGCCWGEFMKDAGEYFVQVTEYEDKPGTVRVDICPAEESAELEGKLEKRGWVQDPDVLDTWFSSALWPFSTMGWPEETEELKFYYPTSLLVTSRDIITLWVSRMVMMGLYNLSEVPFSDVFIHGKILDGNGETMSKSKGNGIDPLAIIETYGADAMRFSLAQMTTDNQDMRMPVKQDEQGRNVSEKFDIGRNFCNKLWNATRFAMMNLDGIDTEAFDMEKLDITDKWLLSRLLDTVKDVTDMLGEFKYSEPVTCLYRFFWNDLCDWYLEWAKPRFRDEQQRPIAQNVLAFALDQVLRLMHPFMPFITEGIFQVLNENIPHRYLKDLADAPASETLIKAAWPELPEILENPEIGQRVSLLQDIIRSVREIRSQYNVAPPAKLSASLTAPEDLVEMLTEYRGLIKTLAGLEALEIALSAEKTATSASAITGEFEVFVHGVIDPEEERKRLHKQRKEILEAMKPVEAKLANENFITRAKPEVVMQARQKLADLHEQLAVVDKHIS